MTGPAFLDFSVQVALLLLSASFLMTVFKVIKGPTLPDRVLALDMLVAVAIGYIAVLGIKTGYTLYLDIAIALGLVGFLATVAFARFVLMRGVTEEEEIDLQEAADEDPEEAMIFGDHRERIGAGKTKTPSGKGGAT